MAPSSVADRADVDACRAILADGSKSFALASLLLPRRVRDPAAALYAFCREADDLVDQAGDAEIGVASVRRRLRAIGRGAPEPSPVDRAVARVVTEHRVPIALLEALVDGFAWDAAGRRYRTIDEVLDYAARVAGSVGVMMTLLMGGRDAPTLARAADLGLAMQLTNIARDVGEDAARDRVYLPAAWLAEANADPRTPSPGLAAVVLRLLDLADDLYASAEEGVDRLPADCRSAIRAASRIYQAIGREIRRHARGGRLLDRAVVPSWRKLALTVEAMATRGGVEAAPRPPHRATAFLLDRVERP